MHDLFSLFSNILIDHLRLTSQEYGFRPVWVSSWFCRWWLCVKLFEQNEHTKFLSPVCIFIWRRRAGAWNNKCFWKMDAPGMYTVAPRCAFARGFATGAWHWTTWCMWRICTVCTRNVCAGDGSNRNAEIHHSLLHFKPTSTSFGANAFDKIN